MTTCQHTLFATAERPALFGPADGSPVILFQPIVDTFAHGILAHECVVRAVEAVQPARIQRCAMEAAAAQNPAGLYLIPLSAADVGEPFDARLPAASVIFEIAENDLTAGRQQDTRYWLKICEDLRTRGFSFALSGAGRDFANIRDFAPEYIRIDRRLVRAIDRPECGAAVSKLVRLAEASGARLIATGVDRVRMVESLWLLGVRFMQGDLFGRPSARVS